MSLKLQEHLKKFFSYENCAQNLVNPQLQCGVRTISLFTLDLIDKDLLNEIKQIVDTGNLSLYFGKTLKDIKIVIHDESGSREHEIYVQYKAPKKLLISAVNLPHCLLQHREYKTIEEIATAFRSNVKDLTSYFHELERIDRFCTVMEPINPSFKHDYRRILLDDRVWLHVEVTPEGLATNIHLVGQSDMWHDKLQPGLLSWDHDKYIVENIMTVFDITEFPTSSRKSPNASVEVESSTDVLTCGICLCDVLSDHSGLPQPLCQNPTCGVYFHRNCLYQWLVACSGSRPPAFGVATGACPTCLQPIACSEKDI